MSTSSTSLDMLANAFFQSSTKGPVDISLGMTPTFFYWFVDVSCLIMRSQNLTYACCLDLASDIGEKLLVLLRIFTPKQNVDRELATFQRVQMFSYTGSQYSHTIEDRLRRTFYLSCRL